MRFYFQLKLALAGGLLAISLFSPAMAEKAETYRFGVWKLHTHFDSFTGQTVCFLRTDYVDFNGHVLSFHLNANPSTLDAEVRINSGPVLHAGPELLPDDLVLPQLLRNELLREPSVPELPLRLERQ